MVLQPGSLKLAQARSGGGQKWQYYTTEVPLWEVPSVLQQFLNGIRNFTLKKKTNNSTLYITFTTWTYGYIPTSDNLVNSLLVPRGKHE